MKRVLFAFPVAAALAIVSVARLGGAAALPACDPDNGGLKLPARLLCAGGRRRLGAARHMAVAPNGDVYVALQERRGAAGRRRRRCATPTATARWTSGRALRRQEHDRHRAAQRLSLRRDDQLGRAVQDDRRAAEAVRRGRSRRRRPAGDARRISDKGIAFDGRGRLYVNVGAPSNACQPQDRRPKVPGQDPCPMLENERRHLEVRREQARTEAGRRRRASRPACGRCRPSPGTTARSTR